MPSRLSHGDALGPRRARARAQLVRARAAIGCPRVISRSDEDIGRIVAGECDPEQRDKSGRAPYKALVVADEIAAAELGRGEVERAGQLLVAPRRAAVARGREP